MFCLRGGVCGKFWVIFCLLVVWVFLIVLFIDSARPGKGGTGKEKEELKFSEQTGATLYITYHSEMTTPCQ